MHEHVWRDLSDLKGTDSPEIFWSQEHEDGLLQLFVFILYLMFIKQKKEKLYKFLHNF